MMNLIHHDLSPLYYQKQGEKHFYGNQNEHGEVVVIFFLSS